MGDDDRELTRWLFATATAMLEDAIEIAAAGQSPRLTPSRAADAGHRLRATAQNIAILAEAAVIVTTRGVNPPENRRKIHR